MIGRFVIPIDHIVITDQQPLRFTNNNDTTLDTNENPDIVLAAGATEEDSGNMIFEDSMETVTLNSQLTSFRDIPMQTNTDYSEYFKRPMRLGTHTISTSDNVGVRRTFYWPADINAFIDNKLQGVTAFRADITARININANVAQCGVYRFYAIPAYGINTACWTAMSQSTSMLPHIDINISCTRTAELKLPWVFPMGATAYSNVNLWEIGVLPLSPLQTGTGDIEGSFSIYVIHDTFETYGSSGKSTFESGILNAEKKEMGVVSRYLNKFTRSFNALRPVPIIGNYMPVLEGISNSLANAAKVWGLSAPLVTDKPHRVVDYTLRSMASGTEPVVARIMSVNDTNSVPLLKVTGDAYDEMSHAKILSKYWYYGKVQWQGSYTSGVQLLNMNVSPGAFNVAYASGSNTYAVSPIHVLASLAKTWKGSIKYRFTFVTTAMHTGRMLIAFGSKNVQNDTPYMYRQLVDISENNCVEFTVPYWLPHATTFAERIGIIQLVVEEALKGPSVVSPNIDVLIEVAAGDDFQTFGTLGDMSNITSTTEPHILPLVPYTPVSFTPQSGCFANKTSFEQQKFDPTIGLHYVGEINSSLRPMIKSEYPLLCIKNTTAGATTIYKGWDPYAYLTAGIPSMLYWKSFGNQPSFHGTNTFSQSSYAGRLLSAFYGWRGSTRKTFADLNAVSTSHFIHSTFFEPNISFIPTNKIYGGVQQMYENGIRIQIPYSSKKVYEVNASGGNLPDEMVTTISGTSAAHEDYLVYESSGDDFDAQLFLGWPIVQVLDYPSSYISPTNI